MVIVGQNGKIFPMNKAYTMIEICGSSGSF